MDNWYQLAQEPLPAPRPLVGGLVEPPEVAGVVPWCGANDLPPQLEAVAPPLWLGVGASHLWLEAGPDPLPWGLVEAPVVRVPVESPSRLNPGGAPIGCIPVYNKRKIRLEASILHRRVSKGNHVGKPRIPPPRDSFI